MENKDYNSDVCLFIRDESSDKLLIIFSGVNAKSFTGYKLVSSIRVNKLFIRDPGKKWYNGKIDNLSQDADELLAKIKVVTNLFKPENVMAFGSSMGGYAAVLFGSLLGIKKIIAFGPQMILDATMPNNPATTKQVKYTNLYNVLEHHQKAEIEIYFGSENLIDVYNLAPARQYNNILTQCIYGAPHDVMSFFHSLGLMRKFFECKMYNLEFTYLTPSFDIMSNDLILAHASNAVAYYYHDQLEKALFHATELTRIIPTWSAGWAFLGKVQLGLKLYEEALDSLEKSFSIFNNTEHPHVDAGITYLKLKDYENAERELKSALRYSTIVKNQNIIRLAIALREQGKLYEAMEYLRKASRSNRKNFGFLFQMGRINLLANNYQCAKKQFSKALEIRPGNKGTQDFLDTTKQIINKQKNNLPKHKMFASGDCLLARRMHYYYEKYGKDWIIGEIKGLVKDCDIVMTNLEAVISNKGAIYPKGDRKPYLFRGAPELLNILTEIGVNLVTTGNNHCVDYGYDALLQQKEILKGLSIASPGSGENISEAKQPAYFKVDDVTIAFISVFTFWPSDRYSATMERPGVFHSTNTEATLTELRKMYEETKKHADLVVLSPHWTKNWTSVPTEDEKKFAREIIDIGYDAILGHSSHILHGIEIYTNKPIIYDMGTFLVDNIAGHKQLQYSAGFVLTFDKNGFEKVEIFPLSLANGRVRIARGNTRNQIKDQIIQLCQAITPDTVLADMDNKLVIEFYNKGKKERQISPPEKIYPVPDGAHPVTLRNYGSPNIILQSKPDWCRDFQPIHFEKDITLFGFKTVEVFWTGASFYTESILQVADTLSTDNWEIHIQGKHRETNKVFNDYHPVSHGIYNPCKWKKGEYIADQAAIRPDTQLAEGIYDIYFGILNRDTNKYLKKVNQNNQQFNNLALVGSTRALAHGISRQASGIDWEGKMPAKN